MASNLLTLEGKVTLITGAGRGIGQAIARSFAAGGSDLILNARKPGSLDGFCRELSGAHNIRCVPLYFDVSQYDQVKGAFTEIGKLAGRLDVAVNNAGIMKDAMLGVIQPALIEEVFATNTYGVLYVMQHACRLMMRDKKGSIINLASLVAVEGSAGQTIYSGSKAAVIGITRSAAKELAPFGIRVNALAPGFIDTDLTRSLGEERRHAILNRIKMKRAGTPEDVAHCCLFLASDLSEYVTGQVIGVDGGMLL